MPRSRGLFASAALESGGFHNYGSKTMSHSSAVFDAVATAVGCKTAGSDTTAHPAAPDAGGAAIGGRDGGRAADVDVMECMRAADVHELLREGTRTSTLPFNDTWDSSVWAPTVDGVELTDTCVVSGGCPSPMLSHF